MSKNFPHDNIYSILGKLDALQPTTQEQHDAKVQEIRESVEAQGSILKGLREVSSTEARLARRFAESKTDEGVIGNIKNTIRAANYDRLAKRSKNAGSWDPMYSRGEWDRDQAVAKQRGQKATDIRRAVADKTALDARTAMSAPNNYSAMQANIDANYKEDIASMGSGMGSSGVVGEETCNECGMPMEGCGCPHTNEGETTRKDGVTTHRKTDFPGYPSDDLEDDDDRDAPKSKGGKGRPRKATTKNPRKDPNAPKKGRGRPSKSPVGGKLGKLPADPFGRVTGSVPKGKKGTIHPVSESIMESVNFKRMMDETQMTLDEMLECLNNDMKDYKASGNLSDRLRDFMHIHHHAKKQMEEAQGGVGHDLVTPQQRLAPHAPAPQGVIGKAVDTAKQAGKWLAGQGGPGKEGPTYEEFDPLEQELNELAKLAGVKVADEGAGVMHFKKQQAEKAGKDSFKLGDKEFPVDESDMEEGNAFSGELAKAKAQHKDTFDVDGKEYHVKEGEYGDTDVDQVVKPINGPKQQYQSMKASTMNPGEGDPGEKNNYDGTGDNKMKQRPNRPAVPVKTLEAKLAAEYESIKKVS